MNHVFIVDFCQHDDRNTNGADSGVWVAADAEALLMGLQHAPADLDVDVYRNRMRNTVLALPATNAQQPPPPQLYWEPFYRDLVACWPYWFYSKNWNEEIGEWQHAHLFRHDMPLASNSMPTPPLFTTRQA